ncbi:hypothetical protein ACH4OY_13815 [Micromonospora rubida]|uniref:Uncharacterized protein n=1 Tax=Micromonospora rubida TaxID=2697657 RepID=A0ABW7SLH8_9ACTN
MVKATSRAVAAWPASVAFGTFVAEIVGANEAGGGLVGGRPER